MPWATVFLPDHIRQLMNLETSLELKRASGFNISSDEVNFLKAISLRSVFFRRGGLMFLPASATRAGRSGNTPEKLWKEYYVTYSSWFRIWIDRVFFHQRPGHRESHGRYGS